MQKLLVFAALALSCGTPARADFLISDPGPPAPAGGAAGEPSPHPYRPPVRTRSSTSPGIAQGFGRRIPLRFAVRQIVPPAIHVSYGPDVDTGMLVDWTGGARWDQVLRAAVEPLGLRLLTSRGAVELRR